MPTANDEEVELAIPEHPALEVKSSCVQPFHKCKLNVTSQIVRPSRFLDSYTNHTGLRLRLCRVQTTSDISKEI